MHSLDCPYQCLWASRSRCLWVSRSRYVSVVGQQLLKCWSTTSKHCSAGTERFRKHIKILLSLFPKSKNQNFQKQSYSRTTNLPMTDVQQDKLNRAHRHNNLNKNAWDITHGAVSNCCIPKLELMPSSSLYLQQHQAQEYKAHPARFGPIVHNYLLSVLEPVL